MIPSSQDSPDVLSPFRHTRVQDRSGYALTCRQRCQLVGDQLRQTVSHISAFGLSQQVVVAPPCPNKCSTRTGLVVNIHSSGTDAPHHRTHRHTVAHLLCQLCDSWIITALEQIHWRTPLRQRRPNAQPIETLLHGLIFAWDKIGTVWIVTGPLYKIESDEPSDIAVSETLRWLASSSTRLDHEPSRYISLLMAALTPVN